MKMLGKTAYGLQKTAITICCLVALAMLMNGLMVFLGLHVI